MKTMCSKCGRRRRRHKDSSWCSVCRNDARRTAYAADKNGYATKAKKESRAKSATARKRGQLKFWYGMTLETYEAMLAEQRGCCAICTRRMVRPNVDHCHKTGAVRGLLCSSCNSGIGHLQDDPHIVRQALAYLTKMRIVRVKSGG